MSYRVTQKCCYVSYFVQALAINFAPLLFVIFQKEYKLGYAKIGTLVFVMFLTQLALDIFSMFFLDKIGYRKSAVISHFFVTAGFILLSFLPDIINPYAGLAISVIVYSVGAGIIEVVTNPIVAGLPKEYGSSLVLTHSFYSWGQLLSVLLTTVALKIFGTDFWKIIAIFWSLVPLVNGILLIKAPISVEEEEESGERGISLLKNKAFLAILILMICAGGSESAMAQWASTFAQNALGVDKTVGDLMGPCMFAFFMGIGRTLYGLFENRLNFKICCGFSSVLCALCYFAAAMSKNPYISLAGCALCGFSISVFWPGIVDFSAKKFPNGGSAMYSSIAIFGDIGCSVAPFLTGIVASMPLWGGNGLRAGLLLNIMYPIIFILLLGALKKEK